MVQLHQQALEHARPFCAVARQHASSHRLSNSTHISIDPSFDTPCRTSSVESIVGGFIVLGAKNVQHFVITLDVLVANTSVPYSSD